MSIKITILNENRCKTDALECSHGLSLLIETENHKILLDTGADDLFIKNAKKLNISLLDIDYLLLSHSHYDHTSGFLPFSEKFSGYTVITSPHFFREKFWKHEEGFATYTGIAFDIKYLRARNIPLIMPHHSPFGIDEHLPDTERKLQNIHILSRFLRPYPIEAEDPSSKVYLNGRYQEDNFSDEIALVIDTEKGLVVISGCCHNGIMNIIETAKAHFRKPVHTFIGGTHLVIAEEERIMNTIAYLDENTTQCYPNHCTGDTALQLFRENCKTFKEADCGTVINI